MAGAGERNLGAGKPEDSRLSALTDQERKTEFLLASMRAAWLNLETWQAELDGVGIALKNGTISLDAACDWLDDIGLLRWLPEGEEARQ
jgi:hypothetical protein